jgi:hypothetical protein
MKKIIPSKYERVAFRTLGAVGIAALTVLIYGYFQQQDEIRQHLKFFEIQNKQICSTVPVSVG